MKRLEIIRKDIAPLWVKIIGIIIFLATILKIVTLTFFDVHPLVYLVFNTLAVAIWTAKELVVLDFEKGVIGEGYRALGITYLDKSKFSGVEKIFINKVNSTETFLHLASEIDVHHVNYKAFLKTTDGVKICIGIEGDKDKLIEKLKKYNEHLTTEVFDTTSREPVRVIEFANICK